LTRNETKQYIIAILVSLTIAIVAIHVLAAPTGATPRPAAESAEVRG